MLYLRMRGGGQTTRTSRGVGGGGRVQREREGGRDSAAVVYVSIR